MQVPRHRETTPIQRLSLRGSPTVAQHCPLPAQDVGVERRRGVSAKQTESCLMLLHRGVGRIAKAGRARQLSEPARFDRSRRAMTIWLSFAHGAATPAASARVLETTPPRATRASALTVGCVHVPRDYSPSVRPVAHI